MLRRSIEASVYRAIADTPVVLLNGARQTGKTTLVQAVGAALNAKLFTFDDASILALASSDPNGFVRGLTGTVILDEVQKVPALFPAIKLAVDANRAPGRFLLTGSANVLTLPRLSESLAGRMELLPVHPFSAGELASVRETFVEQLWRGGLAQGVAPASPEAQLSLPDRLARGGYPEATQRQGGRRSAWFASYISTLLQRDVRDLARVESLHALPNLLKVLAHRTAGLLNVADVARDSGLPHSTLTRYLALLEAIFLVHRIPAWSTNLGKRLVKAPKIYVLDSGLACHLVGASARRLSDDRPLLGRVLETFVVGEIQKQLSWSSPNISMFHLRTAGGAEVDVILEAPDGSLAAIEIKASATVGQSDFQTLKTLREQLGPRFKAGVVLAGGDQVVPFGDRLWLAPISALWSEYPR